MSQNANSYANVDDILHLLSHIVQKKTFSAAACEMATFHMQYFIKCYTGLPITIVNLMGLHLYKYKEIVETIVKFDGTMLLSAKNHT